MTRIIVTGGRDFEDWELIYTVLERYDSSPPPTLVHGGCKSGVDAAAARIATDLGWPVEAHPADWYGSGRAAGPLRNRRMAALGADLCLAFPGGRGTASMMSMAQEHGIPVVQVRTDGVAVTAPTPDTLF
jgi:hypothetical protein